MINNRQAGRRRGRGGQRPQGGGNAGRGGGDSGNRIDSRARGNAPQLLEKYKNLARDAQMAGDRVNTEYYLQFADHYFRVLSDNRARQEEQQGAQGQNRRGREDFSNAGDDDGEEYNTDISNMDDDVPGQQRDLRSDRDGNRGERQDRDDRGNGRDRNDRDARSDRGDRSQRAERPERGDRNDRNERPEREARRPRRQEGDSEPREEAPVQSEVAAEEAPAPVRRRGRPPRAKAEEAGPDREGAGFDAAILPPALSVSASDDDATAVQEERPRRRRRVTRDEGDVAADAA